MPEVDDPKQGPPPGADSSAAESKPGTKSSPSDPRDQLSNYVNKINQLHKQTREEELAAARWVESGRRVMEQALLSSMVAAHHLRGLARQLRHGRAGLRAMVLDSDLAGMDARGDARKQAAVEHFEQLQRLCMDPADDEDAADEAVQPVFSEAALRDNWEQACALIAGLRLRRKVLDEMGRRLRDQVVRANIVQQALNRIRSDIEQPEAADTATHLQLVSSAQRCVEQLEALEDEAGCTVRQLRKASVSYLHGQNLYERGKKRLVEGHLYLVLHVARRYRNMGLQLADLVQEGNIGLIRAVERFDYHQGHRFSTYCWWWISQSITRALTDTARTIRTPVHMYSTASRVRDSRRRLTCATGMTPSVEDLSAASGVTLERVNRVLELPPEPISLERPLNDGEDTRLGDRVSDPNTVDPLEALLHVDLARHARRELARLPRREREILRLRFGIDCQSEHTLEEIGQGYHLTRERIRQLEARALGKLRRRCRRLRSMLSG